MPTESRTEQLLNAYINGDDISNFVPLSRNEQILKDMILGNEQTSSPQSRIESLYKKLDEKIKEGSGGGGSLKTLLDATESCSYLFYKYQGISIDGLISYNDTSNVTNMSYMFNSCYKLTTIPPLNTSNVTDMSSMFSSCYKLTTIPPLNTSNVTNMSYMFNSCYKLTTIPPLNTSNVTDMSSMFSNCSNLTTIPQLDTSKVTNMSSMFYSCSNLTTIPPLNTSNVTNMSNLFGNCRNLTTIPELNTSNVTNMRRMFDYCPELTTIPLLDMCSCTSANDMFGGLKKLTYLKLLNIKISLKIGSGTSSGHLIEKDCLIQIISELIKPSSGTETLTMGTANKAKIADTYIKLLEDDGTGKYPFEVCASTDEGAMTIEAYCNSKNWTLA